MNQSEETIVESNLHRAFIATVIINGAIALLDICAGFFFVFKPRIDVYLETLTAYPGVITTLAQLIIDMSGRVQAIGAFYFFSHGAVKIFLVWGLWKSKLWAYPVSIIFLGAFGLYQLYEILQQFSFVVTAFLLFNIVVIILIIHEYRRIIAIAKDSLNRAL